MNFLTVYLNAFELENAITMSPKLLSFPSLIFTSLYVCRILVI